MSFHTAMPDPHRHRRAARGRMGQASSRSGRARAHADGAR